MSPSLEGVIELVDPTGRLHRVPRGRLVEWCASVGLERPDNVARLDQKDSPYKFSQQWQALNKMRWLQCVDKQTRLPVPGVPFRRSRQKGCRIKAYNVFGSFRRPRRRGSRSRVDGRARFVRDARSRPQLGVPGPGGFRAAQAVLLGPVAADERVQRQPDDVG